MDGKKVEIIMDIVERCKVHEREHSRFDIDVNEWAAGKPHGLSGCFRLKNETQFMADAIESHLPWLDEAVLVIQPSDDATYEETFRLRDKYPEKVKVYEYPFSVHRIATPGHFNSPENSVYTMMHMSNWALSRCKYSWIAKTEGDVIAMRSFAMLREMVDNHPSEMAYYGRVGLNLCGPEARYVSVAMPRNAGWDEAVFNNDPYWHFYRYGKWESVNFHEHRHEAVCCGWSFLHTKRCKPTMVHLSEREGWIKPTARNLDGILEMYEKERPWPAHEEERAPEYLLEAVRDYQVLLRAKIIERQDRGG